MKIIGISTQDKYICEVSHIEIEKFLNQYYNNLNKLKVGDIIDLGKGYDFKSEINTSLKATQELIKNNKSIIETIINGIEIMNINLTKEEINENH